MTAAQTSSNDDGSLVKLSVGEPPDAEYLRRLWWLIADGDESLDDLERWILSRVNGKTDGPVTWELIGRLALFIRETRDSAESTLESLHVIEESFGDLRKLADGEEVDCPRFNEHGRQQWGDENLYWRDEVSRALGIERPGGGWHPEHARQIAELIRGGIDEEGGGADA